MASTLPTTGLCRTTFIMSSAYVTPYFYFFFSAVSPDLNYCDETCLLDSISEIESVI